MKIYINHPQPNCIHPVKWRFEIPSPLGGIRRQIFAPSSTAAAPGPPVSRNKLINVCTDQVSLWKKLVLEIRSLRFARNNNIPSNICNSLNFFFNSNLNILLTKF